MFRCIPVFVLFLLVLGVGLSYGVGGYEYISDANTLGLWHMNDGLADSSPNKFDGAVEGKTAWGEEGWKKGGTPGKSFSFDGSTVINLGNQKKLITPDAITVEAWVYPKDLTGWHLVCCNWGGAEVGAFHFGCEGAIPKFHITTSQGTGFAASADALKVEQWYHLAGTYDGNTIQIYVDGKMTGETKYGGKLIDNKMDVTIGSKHSREYKWIGFLDEVKISNIAKTADKLSANLSGPASVSSIQSLTTTWGSVKDK